LSLHFRYPARCLLVVRLPRHPPRENRAIVRTERVDVALNEHRFGHIAPKWQCRTQLSNLIEKSPIAIARHGM
jgi:hypothetical protein